MDDDLVARVKGIAPSAEVVVTERDEAESAVPDAEVLYGLFKSEIVGAAPGLKWIQSTGAGVDSSLLAALADRDILLTNASGIHGIQVAEHAWALTSALFRGLNVFFRNQLEHKWQRAPLVDLHGATVGIVGLGGIGRRYAERARGFQMRILAADIQVGEKPDCVDALWGIDRLDGLLEEADVVFIACPHTPETDKLIDARALSLMKRTAFLVNTARGSIVDQAALIQALEDGEIAGAGLDVFEQEPLPKDSPLWDMENVIITTHAGGSSSYRQRRLADFFCENLERYVAGKPLLNEVDRSIGYPRLDKRA
jgi:D-3-phosphoglycerate dehydrogenase